MSTAYVPMHILVRVHIYFHMHKLSRRLRGVRTRAPASTHITHTKQPTPVDHMSHVQQTCRACVTYMHKPMLRASNAPATRTRICMERRCGAHAAHTVMRRLRTRIAKAAHTN